MFQSIETALNQLSRKGAAPLLLRFSLGSVFIAHAYAKAAIYTFPGTEQFFQAHGFPGWTAYPVFLLELLGGIALVAGYRTRWVALALIPVMLGALKPHVANGWMFTNQGGGWEYVAFLMAALAAQAVLGDGAFALGMRGASEPGAGLSSGAAAR
jgi:putative oxidoreductase